MSHRTNLPTTRRSLWTSLLHRRPTTKTRATSRATKTLAALAARIIELEDANKTLQRQIRKAKTPTSATKAARSIAARQAVIDLADDDMDTVPPHPLADDIDDHPLNHTATSATSNKAIASIVNIAGCSRQAAARICSSLGVEPFDLADCLPVNKLLRDPSAPRSARTSNLTLTAEGFLAWKGNPSTEQPTAVENAGDLFRAAKVATRILGWPREQSDVYIGQLEQVVGHPASREAVITALRYDVRLRKAIIAGENVGTPAHTNPLLAEVTPISTHLLGAMNDTRIILASSALAKAHPKPEAAQVPTTQSSPSKWPAAWTKRTAEVAGKTVQVCRRFNEGPKAGNAACTCTLRAHVCAICGSSNHAAVSCTKATK